MLKQFTLANLDVPDGEEFPESQGGQELPELRLVRTPRPRLTHRERRVVDLIQVRGTGRAKKTKQKKKKER